MIRIDTDKIKDWECIKKNHGEYFEKYVLPRYNCDAVKSDPLYKTFFPVITKLKRHKNRLAINEIKDLYDLIQYYDSFLEGILKRTVFYTSDDRKKFLNNVNKFFYLIFNYDSFCKNVNKLNHGEWNRHQLITLMEITVCPYCNRAYITNYIESDKRKKTTADLDHFYPKSKYPFLALSLYNFIPSCQICNSRFKGDKFDNNMHLYPYNDEFGINANFKVDSSSMDYILTHSKNFEIKIESIGNAQLNQKINSSIKTFKLEEVYQVHKDYVIEIFIKAKMFNSNRIEDLKSSFPNLYSDELELRGVLMNTNFKDLSKRPLSKLTKDICTQYGIQNDEGWIFNS